MFNDVRCLRAGAKVERLVVKPDMARVIDWIVPEETIATLVLICLGGDGFYGYR